MTKIGVFDSGIGGEAVAARIQQLFPTVEILSVNDSNNVPYGEHSQAEIIELTEHAIEPLLDSGCDAIVIACNTATTNAISELRTHHPDMHFVGIEPMVKPAAAATKTGTIAVLATPGTLKSDRYQELKHEWASGLTVIEPDCRDWATHIEHGEIASVDVASVVTEIKLAHADVIVLGCTHYHWLKDVIVHFAGPEITVLEPSDAIGARLDSLLSINSELPR